MSMVEIMAEAAHKDIHVTGGWEGSTPLYKRLEGKVAIVTGGARGIGEATVKLFAKHGAKVIIADIDSVKGNLLAASVPGSVTFTHCDVTDESSVSSLISTTLARHGHLDILVNNAGVLGSHSRKSILDFDASEFDRVVQVNVRGAALCMKHAARVMTARGTGSIVSTASVAGVVGGMGPHAYAASKHAVVGLTKNVACELGRYGVRVNSVSPFGVATPMLVGAWCGKEGEEERKMGFEEEEVERVEEIVRGMANLKGVTLKAKDVAEAALYLASDESRYVSGHNLVVDGGVTVARNCIGL